MVAFKLQKGILMCLHLIKLQLVLVNFACSLKTRPNGFTWTHNLSRIKPNNSTWINIDLRIGPKPSQELDLVGLKSFLQGPSHRVK
jgi:hypothetical protein